MVLEQVQRELTIVEAGQLLRIDAHERIQRATRRRERQVLAARNAVDDGLARNL